MIKNILVFPCGSEIGLEVYRSLKDQKDIKLIGASSIDDHGKFVFENYIGDIPMIDDDNFLKKIDDIVKEFKIDLIYPCMDIVLTKLKNNSFFENMVIGSSKETVNICQSKLKTYLKLENVIKTPKIYTPFNIDEFPVFSKPEIGSSGRNTFKIKNDLDLFFNIKNYLQFNYLPV